jgi:hypothetical protein
MIECDNCDKNIEMGSVFFQNISKNSNDVMLDLCIDCIEKKKLLFKTSIQDFMCYNCRNNFDKDECSSVIGDFKTLRLCSNCKDEKYVISKIFDSLEKKVYDMHEEMDRLIKSL